ncbi:hypothetical protein CAC42_7553 [Sphaceloma murrayae]|uniref:Uncharacterized protein n=1 Tax=Sphaceloma murrayae TaxID=2082308 RepID=A0A2K1QXH3_9PEZI|nr:hypothetical protein CAC42_7553 [Sphaceloma murrayae]
MLHQSSGNFQPTSLDFINHPNPIEPSATSLGHEASGSKQLESRTNEELLRVLRESRLLRSSQNVAKGLGASQVQSPSLPQSQSSGKVATSVNVDIQSPTEDPFHAVLREVEHSRLTLPRPSQQGVKRQRQQVPPVLQGLHQPPPDAGLLPSINAENHQAGKNNINVSIRPERPPGEDDIASESIIVRIPADLLRKSTRRNKWTDDETHALLQGVQRFGAGNWKKILTCSDYSFNHRTATDLKDRFRVVCSNKDMQLHYQIYAEYMKNPPDLTQAGHLAAVAEVSGTAGKDYTLGTEDMSMPRAKRRQRTKWSEEEDAALLRGFGRYGPSWTSIQLDPVLKKRTPTDIRDRIRTRFSDEYQRAGLAPRPAKPRAQMRSQPKLDHPVKPSTATPSDKPRTAPPDYADQGSRAASDLQSTRPPTTSLPAVDGSWIPEVPIPMESAHSLAHLLNISADFPTSLPPLPSILLPSGPTDHEHLFFNASL